MDALYYKGVYQARFTMTPVPHMYLKDRRGTTYEKMPEGLIYRNFDPYKWSIPIGSFRSTTIEPLKEEEYALEKFNTCDEFAIRNIYGISFAPIMCLIITCVITIIIYEFSYVKNRNKI